MNTYIFTEELFESFRTSILEYINKLQISGWKIEIRHEQIGGDSCARFDYDFIPKTCCFRLTKQIEYNFGLETDIIKLAKHEVLHLFFIELCWLSAFSGDSCSDVVIAKEHELIHKLCDIL